MRILFHSNGPMVPTGYGLQTRQAIRQLTRLGHDVAVSAYYGLSGEPITWEGMRIYPVGAAPWGRDTIVAHAQHWEADLIITLMDFWKLGPIANEIRDCGIKVAAWLPVDCHPLGRGDQQALAATGALPIAMTYWGQHQLLDAGFPQALYVPHAIDTSVFTPPEDRDALKAEMGLEPATFLVGINSANRDAVRKAWPEQLAGFKAFVADYGHRADIRLAMHTVVNSPNGIPLLDLVMDMGLADRVIWSDTYAQLAGLMSNHTMASWYGACDVVSQATYAEGFGIPVLEAQACGTPVVVTEGTAAMEISAYGMLRAEADPFWNWVHHAWWRRPRPGSIAGCLSTAFECLRGDLRIDGDARRFRARGPNMAVDYDETYVADQYWKPVLDTIEAM